MKLDKTRLLGAVLFLLGAVFFWFLGPGLVDGVRDSSGAAGDAFAIALFLTLLGLGLLVGGRRVSHAFSRDASRREDHVIVFGTVGVVATALIAVMAWPGPAGQGPDSVKAGSYEPPEIPAADLESIRAEANRMLAVARSAPPPLRPDKDAQDAALLNAE